jgi:hydroxyisourate hydrolase
MERPIWLTRVNAFLSTACRYSSTSELQVKTEEPLADGRHTISTHVLDTVSGAPAPGVPVHLVRVVDDGGEVHAGGGTTDADGRIRDLLASELTPGDYRLHFDLSEHGGGFFTGMSVELRVRAADRSYHVPLLLAPFAMTTYRGS